MNARFTERLALIALVWATLAWMVGCDLGEDPETIRYVARVDSVRFAGQPAPSDTLRLRLFASLGPDGCHQLEEISAQKSPGRVDLTVYGVRTSDGFCMPLPARLDDWAFTVPPPFSETLLLVVHQPDGSELRLHHPP